MKTSISHNLWLYLCVFLFALMFCLPRESVALVVLQYHHVSVDTPPATSVSPERFEQHMNWLAENQYQILSMPDLLALLSAKKALPDKSAVITFDDGYTSIYTKAWPLLRERKWPFTIFVNSQHHDEKNRQYMSWEQLRELAKAGVTIGNHSVSHPHMIRLRAGETHAQWLKRAREEIEFAQKRIDTELGRQPHVFAYPFGEHNRELEELLSDLGYIAFAQHSGPIAPFDQLQALPRFPFGGNFGEIKDFALKASSLPMPFKKVTLVDERMQPLRDPLLPDKVDKAGVIIEGDPAFLKKVSCFYTGEPVNADLRDGKLHITTVKAIPPGRSKFNCTAPEKGRFYWFAKMLIKKNPDGSWYKE
jgi:poly-beta-1,6-N-acetyl-D-glucosamine N-deacetylase